MTLETFFSVWAIFAFMFVGGAFLWVPNSNVRTYVKAAFWAGLLPTLQAIGSWLAD